MRTRSTVTGGFVTLCYRAYQGRSSCTASYVTIPIQSQTSYSGEKKTKVIVDTQTPGFQSLLKCGGFLPLNPVTITTTTETRTPGDGIHNFTFSGGCFRNRNTGPLWLSRPWLLTLPAVDEGLIDAAATNAIADCKAGIYDALTDLAELSKTADLVGLQYKRVVRFALKAARLAKAIRRGEVKRFLRRGGKKPRDWREIFSKLWLEYRYGWLPAIHSAQSLIAALQSDLKKGDIVRGSSRVSVTLDDVKTVVTNPTSYTTRTEICVISGTRTYRGKAFASIKNSNAFFQFDPLVTTWELIPFSFIVDWFLQIGNWLEAVSPFTGSGLLGSQVSIKDEYTIEQTFDESYSDAQHSGVFNGLSTKIEVESYERFPHGAGVLPSWNLRLNPSRIADLFALILGGRSSVMRYSD
jgi:hypothetical protein